MRSKINLASVGRGKKKGIFEGLSNAALALVILTITVGLGALILDAFQNVTDSGSTAYTVIGKGITALSTFGDFFNLIVIAIVGVALFILILAGLSRFRGGKGGTGF